MASAAVSTSALHVPSSAKHPARHPFPPPPTPHCVVLPALYRPSHSPKASAVAASAGRDNYLRNVVALATTGEAPAASTEVAVVTETPEILKKAQRAWDQVEDKYAVASLGVAFAIALWTASGMISAIERVPLLSAILELVGIGYTGWFVYGNLIFKPDREVLVAKITNTYKDILGSEK